MPRSGQDLARPCVQELATPTNGRRGWIQAHDAFGCGGRIHAREFEAQASSWGKTAIPEKDQGGPTRGRIQGGCLNVGR